MGSLKRSLVFDPLDLEIIDLVYEVAWSKSQRANQLAIWLRTKSGRLRYASRSSP